MTARAPAVDILVERAGAAADSKTQIEGRTLAAWRGEARRELGLPDAPVAAAGHQAVAWHPGIVAKTFWTDAQAKRDKATPVHVVVDQDGFDGFFVEWPELKDGFWTAKGHRFAAAAASTAALRVPAFQPRDIRECANAPDFVRDGLQRLTNLLREFQRAANAPLQASLAQLKGLENWIQAPRVVSASQLIGTSFAQHLIDRMLKEPQACAAAFNEALRLHPHAARPLQVNGAQTELPLWLLDESGSRVRATVDRVRDAQSRGAALLPRAFLLGVLLRTALADRFTHGLGGKVYEDVSDEWMRRWLGWRPPAFDVVSATLRLPLEVKEVAGANSFRAAWSDPDLATSGNIGAGPSARRKKFLNDIASLPRRSPQRRRIFEAMIADRGARRGEFQAALQRLQDSEQTQQQSKRSKELALRRSWCVLLHPPESISRMRDELRERLAHKRNT